MKLPELIPSRLSTSNPGFVEKYNFNIELAQLTGTNGPRDLYSAYSVDFFDKYSAAFAKNLNNEVLIGYDGSRVHQSISRSVREYMRRSGVDVQELDEPVTVPEFMYFCSKLGVPGCFYGRSHSPQQYVGLKLVINARNAVNLLEKSGVEIDQPKNLDLNHIYGFLPRTLAPPVEKSISKDMMVHPKDIGKFEFIESKALREEFVKSLKKVTPMAKIEGKYIVDCRHSMAGEVWDIIKAESKAEITLHNNKLNPIAPDRDPRVIWDELADKYHDLPQAVFDHDGDADRTFLVKTPGKGRDKIVHNQEESFTLGLIAEAQERKPDAYILVQERISLIMLNALEKLTDKVYATAQGEPPFFMGVLELFLNNPKIKSISGADYTNIYFNNTHPICMKSPFQQALWQMHYFDKTPTLPEFPSVNLDKTEVNTLDMTYPQRLEKVLVSSPKLVEYFKKNFKIIYSSDIDGLNYIIQDNKENMLVVSIRPSGTGRYIKIYTEVGLGPSPAKERQQIAKNLNKDLGAILGL
ncbi:MAG: hypothetical protein ACTSO7_09070 [Candidatus Heimdallarchaeota archaeon]